MPSHPASRSVVYWATMTVTAALVIVAVVDWGLHLAGRGQEVARNVMFHGEDMEGLEMSRVEAMVADHANDVLTAGLRIDHQMGGMTTSFEDLGFSYDVAATTRRVMQARHEGGLWDRFRSWVSSVFKARPVTAVWSLDRSAARASLENAGALTPVDPVEPMITMEGRDYLHAVAGQDGRTADIERLVDRLTAVDLTEPPETVAAELTSKPPVVSDQAAAVTAEGINELTRRPRTISVQGQERSLTPRQLRSHIVFEQDDGTLVARFDSGSLHAEIESMFDGRPVGEFQPPTFDVVDGEIIVTAEGDAPQVCCRTDGAQWLGERILAGSTGPFGLATRPTSDPELRAWADGSVIREVVGEFTTPHQCCQTRVRNIQRMADLVRGAYVLPGETLSLNEYIGPRTIANGFSAAGAIRRGHLVSEVGGGVSQFATTIFNAAYFAGLDFDEYRSHTIYFSRYPYGREATISNPAPDLAFSNTTNHPVLIWTSYTGTSITVTFYSTRHIEVEELGQRTSSRGACTHVETDRQRTYPDGRVVVDTVVADYRPAEGIDCSGNRIPAP